MAHHTKDKGDLAVAKVSLDLVVQGYSVFVPAFSEHLPFDLIAYKDRRSYRIQVKHALDRVITSKTTWSDKNGFHTKVYQTGDFDYYGLYLPKIDRCVYPSLSFSGRKICIEIPGNVNDRGYLWWEDFLSLTDEAKPRFEYDVTKKFAATRTSGKFGAVRRAANEARRKVPWPSKSDLEKLVWQFPLMKIAKQFGVSDRTVAKWVRIHEIAKPENGHWAKLNPIKPT